MAQTQKTAPKAPARSPDRLRAADLAMIHMAAKSLFGDVSKGAPGREDYEDWLHRLTGKRSAAALTQGERIDLVRHLRREGLVKERGAGGRGEGRPTQQQWSHLGALARQMGWQDGLEDGRMQAFIQRTAKVTAARFITREQASAVITGLRKWLAQRAAGGGADHEMP